MTPGASLPRSLLAAALLSGCAAMLPDASNSARFGFASFEAAESALAKVVPYRTTLTDLETFGFDVRHSPNVVRISYPDSVARLAPNSRVALEDMDVGIRDCIVARLSCQVYEFHFAHQSQQRSGNFLLDFFNFRRNTTVSGWQFDALVVVKDATVLFTSHGGTPQTSRLERRTNPLGPLQSIGESSGGMLAR